MIKIWKLEDILDYVDDTARYAIRVQNRLRKLQEVLLEFLKE